VALDRLAARVPIRPGKRSLEVARFRPAEKGLVRELGGRTAPYIAVETLDELGAAFAEIGAPSILKTSSLGYDGKGQVRLGQDADLAGAWGAIGQAPAVLEGFVAFETEFSVILCRGADGGVAVWDTPENRHASGILDTSTVPAPAIVLDQAEAAVALAQEVAGALDHIGVLTLEFFACADGPVFNEMAPRVHNSGHWTIEGAATSQFEAAVRAACGWTLGDSAMHGTGWEMQNLLGPAVAAWPDLAAERGAHLHIYGKSDIVAGRKMGHVTRQRTTGR
jgi:5-(carboxyamino)imidazole ribonucleotide synthase